MAMLKLRDGRELEVKETVDTLATELAKGGLVRVTEVRRTVKRKFPTPIDTKAEFEREEIEHLVAADHVMVVQPTPAEQALKPVHNRVHANMQAVSGPFKHDFDQHVVECEVVDGRKVDKLHDVDCTKCADLAADEAAVKAADQHGVKTADKADDTQK